MGIEELLMDLYEKKGEKKGEKRGEKKGEKKAIENGLKKGIVLDTRQTALKMKKQGLAITLIADITGLSIEEIEGLN